MKPTKHELARHLRTLNLYQQPISELAAWCQAFGQSGRGSQRQLYTRLRVEVWKPEYDEAKDRPSDDHQKTS